MCEKCGECEEACPQNLPIQTTLENVANEFEGKWFKQISWLVSKVFAFQKWKDLRRAKNWTEPLIALINDGITTYFPANSIVEMTTENKPQRGVKAKFCPGKGFKREKGDAVLRGDPLGTF